ncbi:putative metal-binding motif-containing protein, partial [bacterium]|nr:putative metal-binding motif-containing protein [bacterium]
GDPAVSHRACDAPSNYVTDNTDCDDNDPEVNPGKTEIPYNGKDDDCNPATPDDDLDGDGYLKIDDCDDNDPEINPAAQEIYDGLDNNCDGQVDEICYFDANIIVTGQEYLLFGQQANVVFGLDASSYTANDPNNWSLDNIVRLELIDSNADISDPATFTDSTYLVDDIREASGQNKTAWYIEVEIGAADPGQAGYYPTLSWEPLDFGCTNVYNKEYVYQLLRGLGETGTVLVNDMLTQTTYQTVSQDGDPIQYFTILWREKPKPPAPPTTTGQTIWPWPWLPIPQWPSTPQWTTTQWSSSISSSLLGFPTRTLTSFGTPSYGLFGSPYVKTYNWYALPTLKYPLYNLYNLSSLSYTSSWDKWTKNILGIGSLPSIGNYYNTFLKNYYGY